MGCQFAVRSRHHLKLKTVFYNGVKIVRTRENGLVVFEIKDPDASLELIVRHKSCHQDGYSPALGQTIDGAFKPPSCVAEAASTETAPVCIVAAPPDPATENSEGSTSAASKAATEATATRTNSADNNSSNDQSKIAAGIKKAPNSVLAESQSILREGVSLINNEQSEKTVVGATLNQDRHSNSSNNKDGRTAGFSTPIQNSTCAGIQEAAAGSDSADDEIMVDETGATEQNESDTKKPSTDTYFSQAVAASALTALAEKEACTKKESVHDIKWNKRYNELLAYKLEHGNCNVTKRINLSLQKWISNQRSEFRRKKLSEKRAVKLKDVGLLTQQQLDAYDCPKTESKYEQRMRTNWESRYQELAAYKREHGTCNVSSVIDKPLSRWVLFQRNEFRNGNMSSDRIAKLDEIGMLDHVREEEQVPVTGNECKTEARWNLRFKELVEFKQENGHCSVSWSSHPKLKSWMNHQLTRFRMGRLSEEHLAKLTDIGFEFTHITQEKKNWDQRYSQLNAFMQEHGHSRVPADYEPCPNLDKWVNNLRIRYKSGKLSVQQVEELNRIDFEWEVPPTEENESDNEKVKMESLWNQKFDELVAFKQEYGHFIVPKRTHARLAKWIKQQRQKFQRGNNLSDDHIAKLNQIGFTLDFKEEKWNKHFTELQLFIQEHGHCKIPSSYKPSPYLSYWVDNMRVSFSSGKLSADHVAKLNGIGFVWDDPTNQKVFAKKTDDDKLDGMGKLTKVLEREIKMQPNAKRLSQWDQRFNELVIYKREHGHCLVSNNSRLSNWTKYQLWNFRRGKLSEDRIAKLTELGFSWFTQEEEWETRYSELKLFMQEHGHCEVPSKYEPSPYLENWIKTMRMSYKSLNLSEEHVVKLNEIGFIWVEQNSDASADDAGQSAAYEAESKWNLQLNELAAYKREHGHWMVSRSSHPKLAYWANHQAKQFKQGKLSVHHVAKLDEIGFDWDIQQNNWDTRFSELKVFMQEHGHCNIPLKYEPYPHIRRWVDNMRIRFKSGKLNVEQVSKLNEIGFDWEAPANTNKTETFRMIAEKSKWDAHYNELIVFKQEHGHCNAPMGSHYKLFDWVSRQIVKFRQGKLSDDQVSRLNEIGFVWERRDEQWNTRYSELKLFQQEHGHCEVPYKYIPNPPLGRWIRKQRENMMYGKMSAERKAKLNEIGFVWRVSDVNGMDKTALTEDVGAT